MFISQTSPSAEDFYLLEIVYAEHDIYLLKTDREFGIGISFYQTFSIGYFVQALSILYIIG